MEIIAHRFEFAVFDKLSIDIQESKRLLAEENEACEALERMVIEARNHFEMLESKKESLGLNIARKRAAFNSNLQSKESLQESVSVTEEKARLQKQRIECVEQKNLKVQSRLTEISQKMRQTMLFYQEKYPCYFTGKICEEVEEMIRLEASIVQLQHKLKEVPSDRKERGWSQWKKCVVQLATRIMEQRKPRLTNPISKPRAVESSVRRVTFPTDMKPPSSATKSALPFRKPTPYSTQRQRPSFKIKKLEMPKLVFPKLGFRKVLGENQQLPKISAVSKLVREKENKMPDEHSTSHIPRTPMPQKNVHSNLPERPSTVVSQIPESPVIENHEIPNSDQNAETREESHDQFQPSHENMEELTKNSNEEPAKDNLEDDEIQCTPINPDYSKKSDNNEQQGERMHQASVFDTPAPAAQEGNRSTIPQTPSKLDNSFSFQYGNVPTTPASNALSLFGSPTTGSPNVTKHQGLQKPTFSLFSGSGGDDEEDTSGFFNMFQSNSEHNGDNCLALFGGENEHSSPGGAFKLF